MTVIDHRTSEPVTHEPVPHGSAHHGSLHAHDGGDQRPTGDPREGDRHTGHGHAGHGQAGHGHAGHADEFRRRFWVALALTLPAVVYSHMAQDLLGYTAPAIPAHSWIAPVFGTAVFLVGAPVFLAAGWEELRSRRPGMMLLISMGLLVAFGASLATQLGWIDVDLWFELATLVTIMLLGHWQEAKAVGRAEGALTALADLLPDDAERIDGDAVTVVPITRLHPGDLVLVRPGSRVPADGTVTEGSASLDESMVTGESRPVHRGSGARVVAGTVALGGPLRVRVDAVGDDTALAGIGRLVADARASRSRAQALADRVAALLVYVALLAGITTFAAWAALGDVDEAVVRTVTVLVIACPHALGLAIPLVVSLSTSLAAGAGILVKDRLALERMRSIDAVLFDKTGTLTRGAPAVVAVATVDGTDERTVLDLAAAAEADSEHPLARAIVAAAGGSRSTATDVRAEVGRGITARVDDTDVAVGGPALLRGLGLTSPHELGPFVADWSARGASVLHVVADGRVVAALALEDAVRPESREAVDALHARGIRVVMITGDAREVALAVGDDLGVDEVLAEVLPEDKDAAVAALQARGMTVAMVGDGVNDAPALARADVGLAIGAGTDVAIESAGVVLASSDPRSVVGVVELSRASYRKMVQNLVWGAGYNVVAIPLAAGALAWAGIVLSPAVGAILMSASTIVVALNAQLLRRLDLRTVTEPTT